MREVTNSELYQLGLEIGQQAFEHVYEYLLHQTQYASHNGNRSDYDNYESALNLLDSIARNQSDSTHKGAQTND